MLVHGFILVECIGFEFKFEFEFKLVECCLEKKRGRKTRKGENQSNPKLQPQPAHSLLSFFPAAQFRVRPSQLSLLSLLSPRPTLPCSAQQDSAPPRVARLPPLGTAQRQRPSARPLPWPSLSPRSSSAASLARRPLATNPGPLGILVSPAPAPRSNGTPQSPAVISPAFLLERARRDLRRPPLNTPPATSFPLSSPPQPPP
jgi:hypothetical protein